MAPPFALPSEMGITARAGVIRVIAAAAVSVVPLGAAAQPAATLPCTLEPGPTRAIAEVIDGETVRLDDRVELRLIGALAPRASDAGADETTEWPPAREATAALKVLVEGQGVALAFAGPRADRHGRVLAHLFIGEGDAQIWVQGRLIESGHARAHALPGSDVCMAALLARERGARSAGLGLWSHAAYQIRPADRPTELARFRFTFQLVRGRVEHAQSTRGLAILQLASGEVPPADGGKSQRGAFRAIWKHAAGRAAGLERAENLVGRNVLVHGWIDAHRGPEIEIIAAGQLEVED